MSRLINATLYVLTAFALPAFVGCANVDPVQPDPGERFLVFYDVADLFKRPRDFEAPDLGVVIPKETEKEAEPPLPISSLDAATNARIEKFAAAISDQLFASDKNAGIANVRGKLAVRATAEVHENIAALLEQLRHRPVTLIQTEVSFIPVDATLIERLEVSDELAAALQDAINNVSEIQSSLDAMVRHTHSRRDLDDRFRVSDIRSLPNQRTHSLAVSQKSIIADFKVVERGEKKRLEPIVGYLNTGIVVEVKPTLTKQNKSIEIELHVKVVKEIKTHNLKASDLSRFKGISDTDNSFIEVPEVDLNRLFTSLTVPVGEWTVAGGYSGITHRTAALEPNSTVNE